MIISGHLSRKKLTDSKKLSDLASTGRVNSWNLTLRKFEVKIRCTFQQQRQLVIGPPYRCYVVVSPLLGYFNITIGFSGRCIYQKRWEYIWHEGQIHREPLIVMVHMRLPSQAVLRLPNVRNRVFCKKYFSAHALFPQVFFTDYFKRCALIHLTVLMFLEMKYRKLREEKGNSIAYLIESQH